jgi:serine protease Do
MKRYTLLSTLVLGLVALAPLQAQQSKDPKLIKVFRSVVAKPGQSTVRVCVLGKDAALGTVLSQDGWVLTKYSELKVGQITCKLADGTEYDARLIGHDELFDLAMLKLEDAEDLTPIAWSESKASKVGHWVASPGVGKDPVAVGVISVAAREIKAAKKQITMGAGIAYLGVTYEPFFNGVKIEEVLANSPGQKGGLKAGDQILTFNGEQVESADEQRALLSRCQPNDEIRLKIIRDKKELDLIVKLSVHPSAKNGKSRGDLQNNMGSKLSARRTGFPVILQHDSVLLPTDCGGPLCNLEGQVIGINIARAGRTESYAIPSEAVRPLLEKLKAAKKDKAP